MQLWHALVLGLVQGLGEFLPISSSAHLILVPWFFGWTDPGLGFDVALHAGTLLAVVFCFRRDLLALIAGFCRSLAPATRNFADPHQRLAWWLALASVPGAVAGKLLEERAEHAFRAPLLVAATLAVFGIVLWATDAWGRRRRQLDAVRWGDALLIGLSQALAVIPGVSRSGSTIAAGLALGLTRTDAARFSFLMSVPIIFGACLVKARHCHDGVTTPELLIGFATAAVVGFLSIRCLLRYITAHSYALFTLYRLALAAAVVAVFLIRGR